MAEVKNTKEAPIRVIAGTFPAACGDYAKKLTLCAYILHRYRCTVF